MTEFQMTPLVRKYSLQLEDEDVLPRSLRIVANEEQEDERRKALQLQEWREWIRFDGALDDHSSERLTHSSRVLAETWKSFGPLFDVDSTKCIAGYSLPSIDALQRAVHDASTLRESNNDYSFIFSIIPQNDKYTILITGVLSSIAKAAAKYQDTAERISQALDQITSDISQVKKRANVADTPEIRGFVADFFVGIFELLCLIMSWYKSRSKRVLGSFNKSFTKDLDGKIDAIQKALKDMSEETSLITQLRVHDVHEDVAGIALTSVSTDRKVQQMMTLLEQCVVGIRSLRDIGHVAAQQLNSMHQDFVRQKTATGSGLTGHPMIGQDCPVTDEAHSGRSTGLSGGHSSDRIVSQSSKSDLLHYSQLLKPFIDDGRRLISIDGRLTARSVLPREVVGEMERWMASVKSKLLWVEGISSHASEPVLSTAALNICSIAENAGIPCMSYFCTTIHDRNKTVQRDPSATHTEATCVSLFYSIIVQLCETLPEDFTGTEKFNNQFQLLDGTLKSLEIAISLIKHLFTCLPPLTVWVLDKFPFAGTKSTVPYIKKLIDVLRDEKGGRVTKVLFTTEGNTPWLSGSLQAREHFLASRMTLNRPGRVIPGAVSPLFRGKFQGGDQQK
ncbi:hypothetical protein F5B22DRAFT_650506 [Xylaria bambusicola]|uniref:uncharacterized protein n=1 Tax=Xylaria bambusicola TaxID=326684 RepID=UPI002008975B|nr:uncharacterized protein F5B22DRAFT_650506 [Xylaria bambusicola]KAI0506688.1 hypothetical protein F5B22DRAFT_650506 [Xylaria bambusicola]